MPRFSSEKSARTSLVGGSLVRDMPRFSSEASARSSLVSGCHALVLRPCAYLSLVSGCHACLV